MTYPFLHALTPRDRDWPRVAIMLVSAPVAGLLINFPVMVVLFALGVAEPDGPRLQRSALYVLQIALMLGSLAAGVVLAARVIFGRPVASWVVATPRFRKSLLVLGAAATLPAVAVLMAIDALAFGGELQFPILEPAGLDLKLGYFCAMVVGLLVAAAAEEVVFRGYVLQQTAAFTRNIWVIVALNGVLFSLFHLEFDPSALAARALAGAAFAWAALRLGGLEFAIGAHLAANLMLALFQAPMLPEDPVAAGGLDEVLGEVALAAYTVWIVELLRRRIRPFSAEVEAGSAKKMVETRSL
ncbi:MAG: CPBP family intramembrane metalloprotease [Phenylobacterium sp.]|uniref:CPBP family intramembrane glutamic endopeptidase n=1 Tax=Phenylobacterium sp. TaxID=1871053 RepID=UPI0027330F32|nr:CPBP family intramembrane glutamic endopeptidase [Phenylobacterium sp.]MDP3746006.1 CPBP family intramembrane metalloprotease [Phenylobacterium sp.]